MFTVAVHGEVLGLDAGEDRRRLRLTRREAGEGWGMTITEAGACGTPAVARRVGGHVDAIEDGVSGLLADDPADLGNKLASVLTDPALQSRLAEGASKRAGKLTWSATATAVAQALAEDARRRQR